MNRWRSPSIHQASIALSSLGYTLLAAGFIIGWIVPWVAENASFLRISDTPLAAFFKISLAPFSVLGNKIDINAFLGADITALAVIVAVLIGYNASARQIAGQLHSLALVHAIVWSLLPVLLSWIFTAAVALVYFLIPPVLVAQLLQVMLWFGAVVLLMIAYLWSLPWLLSGEHAAGLAIKELRRQSMKQWEASDGYSVLQTAIASAAARSDLGTVRNMTTILGEFLANTYRETTDQFDRKRYRAVKNLLSGCMQNASSAPNSVSYHLGFVAAAVLLQGVAVGTAYDGDRDLFSGVFRVLRNEPERLAALWTGLRHSLCRKEMQGTPYLPQYWHTHRLWKTDDPRRVQFIAELLVRFHAQAWRELGSSFKRYTVTDSDNTRMTSSMHPAVWSSEEAGSQAIGMLTDLYRDIAKYLVPAIDESSSNIDSLELRDFPQQLMDAVHTLVLQQWPADKSEECRHKLIGTYEYRSAEIKAMRAGVENPH